MSIQKRSEYDPLLAASGTEPNERLRKAFERHDREVTSVPDDTLATALAQPEPEDALAGAVRSFDAALNDEAMLQAALLAYDETANTSYADITVNGRIPVGAHVTDAAADVHHAKAMRAALAAALRAVSQPTQLAIAEIIIADPEQPYRAAARIAALYGKSETKPYPCARCTVNEAIPGIGYCADCTNEL